MQPNEPDTLRDPRYRAALDVYAMTLSTLCLLHCIGTPVLLLLLPVLASWIGDHWVHQGLVLLAAPATLLIVRAAGPRGQLVWLAVSGLTLLVLAAFVPPLEPWETPITVAGSVALAGAHGWRWRSQRGAAEAVSEHVESSPQAHARAKQNALP